ncbi:MAG: hypothetical protein LUI05_09545 [Oscillospiraceae bacterium]|nr:hypothetical protein [Oscillospiraceae bacterium]
MKKVISAAIAVATALVMLFGITAYAAQARYSYTSAVSSTLSISSGTANCQSVLSGTSAVTHIFATQYLEKKSGTTWTTVSGGTWNDSTSNISLVMTNSKSGLSSGTYRLRSVFVVYSQANCETVEKTSSEVTI